MLLNILYYLTLTGEISPTEKAANEAVNLTPHQPRDAVLCVDVLERGG